MKRLSEDTNIENFYNPTPLNFDKWLSNDMNKTGDGCQKGKTGYQIVMATFRKPSTGINKAPTDSVKTRARNSTATAAPHKMPSTEAPKPPSKADLVQTSKDIMRKVQRLGQVVREKLSISIRK